MKSRIFVDTCQKNAVTPTHTKHFIVYVFKSELFELFVNQTKIR